VHARVELRDALAVLGMRQRNRGRHATTYTTSPSPIAATRGAWYPARHAPSLSTGRFDYKSTLLLRADATTPQRLRREVVRKAWDSTRLLGCSATQFEPCVATTRLVYSLRFVRAFLQFARSSRCLEWQRCHSFPTRPASSYL
jgi:hypothetical protein